MAATAEEELCQARYAYAKDVLATAGINNSRFESAFAELRREDFLGPGPWQIFDLKKGYISTANDDPIHVYRDILIGITPGKGLNNGQPSFLTFLISLGDPQPGEHAVHIGTGQGYYTAFIAKLVALSGHVTGIEYEPDLAAQAAANLSDFQNVKVTQGDGTAIALKPADVIYVNAGASQPADVWLDALKDGGRLILPLTVSYLDINGLEMTRGSIFLVQRHGDRYSASWKSSVMVYPCAGARDSASETALAKGFEKGGWDKVTRLYRSGDLDEDQCWVRAPDWSLAYH